MSPSSSKMSRPVCFCLVLSLIMLLVPAVLIPFWVNKVKRIEGEIKVFVSTNQENGVLNHFHIVMKFGFILMILMMVTMTISIVTFFILTIRTGRRELIKQNEATQQEEIMKNMNKSNAFVQANRDLRVALASISELIELCGSTQDSQVINFLNMMESCTNDLLDFKNRILSAVTEETKEEPIEEPEVDSAYHTRQKEVLVDVKQLSGENLPLKGKKILVIEDTTLLTISKRMICKLGATFYTSTNSQKVVEYVSKILRDQRDIGPSMPSPPFDYILIDCEMEKIGAFATTICIRKQLSYYGFQIPFIGLTAHANVEVLAKICQAEMELYLPKPLKPDLLLMGIDYLENGNV